MHEIYHSDHLGSSSYITDNFGRPSHYYEYLPFGELMTEHNQSKYYIDPYPTQNMDSYNNPYKFNGKEMDKETGMYYYSARYYDPRISIFVSVDPLAEKYRNISAYAYVANNPINFVDPDGRDIRIYYNKRKNAKGKMVASYWDFNGENSKNAPDNQFVTDFLEAYNYNINNGGGDNLKKAAFDTNERFEVFEIEEMEGASAVNLSGRNLIYWNSLTGLQVEDGDILSPATILEHEFDHSIARVYDTEQFYKRKKSKLKDYTDKEEYRVITGSETKTARANREISTNKTQSRFSHKSGMSVPVQSPTSNKVRNTLKRTDQKYKITKGLYNW